MRKPVALLINDIHVDRNNISDFKMNWDEMLNICKDKHIYDVVIGGDVFTSRASQTLDVLLAVSEAFHTATKNGIELTIAEGNHDKVDQERVEGYNHIFKYYPHINVIDVYDVLEWEGCDYALVPMSYFPETGSFEDKLLEVRKALDYGFEYPLDHVILYIHEGVHGALGEMDLPSEVDSAIFDGFKEVLCGHYHNRCVVPMTDISYIGSSRQKDFGEDDEKGYNIMYDDGSIEFIQNQVNTRYKNIEVDYKGLEALDLSSIDLQLTKVKVKINCSDAQKKLIDKEKLYGMGISKLDFKTEKTEVAKIKETDLNTKYDKEGIKKEYHQFSDEKSLNEKLGIEYLNKIV